MLKNYYYPANLLLCTFQNYYYLANSLLENESIFNAILGIIITKIINLLYILFSHVGDGLFYISGLKYSKLSFLAKAGIKLSEHSS